MTNKMDDLAGQIIKSRYFLRKKIGMGGAAEVYYAWDQKFSASVAIKILRRDRQQDIEWRDTLINEGDWLEKLKHPFIVRCYGLEHHGDLPFLVMDWVEGKDLHREIDDRKRSFTPAEAANLLWPVCSALSFTHSSYIFHCDIKPANILLSVKGDILLTDFSVARKVEGSKNSGGTPVYMAPEQIRDSPVSKHTDIYGLGITLYEMLTGGTPPFRGDSAPSASAGSTSRSRVEWEHCYLPLPSITQFNPTLSPAVIRILEKALTKDPEQRHASALDFYNELAQATAASGSDLRTTIKRPEIKFPPWGTNITGNEPYTPSPSVQPPLPQPPTPSPSISRSAGGPRLVGRSGSWNGKEFYLTPPRSTIGRAPGNSIVIPDQSVSRCHATLILGRRGIYIRDENSTAGTFVNQQPVLPTVDMMLSEGSIIQIGSWVFEFHYA